MDSAKGSYGEIEEETRVETLLGKRLGAVTSVKKRNKVRSIPYRSDNTQQADYKRLKNYTRGPKIKMSIENTSRK